VCGWPEYHSVCDIVALSWLAALGSNYRGNRAAASSVALSASRHAAASTFLACGVIALAATQQQP